MFTAVSALKGPVPGLIAMYIPSDADTSQYSHTVVALEESACSLLNHGDEGRS